MRLDCKDDRRTLLSVLLSLLTIALVAVACDDGGGEEEPTPEPMVPIAITEARRAVVVNETDVEALNLTSALSQQDIDARFDRVILWRQLHDQLPIAETPTENDRRFSVRMDSLWSMTQENYEPFGEVVIVMDLLDASGEELVAPPHLREAQRTFQRGTSETYPRYVRDEAKQGLALVAGDLSESQELVFVLGVGMSNLETAEFVAFKEFYASVYGELRQVAEDAGHSVQITTAFDWEAFVARQDAASADEEGGALPDDASAWEELLDGVSEQLDVLIVKSYPVRFETPGSLPEDHYQRLRHLLEPAQEVGLFVHWPSASAEDTSGGVRFLQSFRVLAASMSVSFVSWPRLFDLDAKERGRWTESLGGPTAYAYSGLAQSSGNLKPLWDEYLDTGAPAAE